MDNPRSGNSHDICSDKGCSQNESSQVDCEPQILPDSWTKQGDDQWLELLDEHFATEMALGVLPFLAEPTCAEAIVTHHPQKVLEVNAKFLTILGFKPTEVIQTLRIVKGPMTDDGKLSRLIHKSLQSSPMDENIVLYRKDGEELPCIVRGQPTTYDMQPACKLCIVPYSFEPVDRDATNGGCGDVVDCILRTAAKPVQALEQFRICGDSSSFRELLGFRADDAVQVFACVFPISSTIITSPMLNLYLRHALWLLNRAAIATYLSAERGMSPYPPLCRRRRSLSKWYAGRAPTRRHSSPPFTRPPRRRRPSPRAAAAARPAPATTP